VFSLHSYFYDSQKTVQKHMQWGVGCHLVYLLKGWIVNNQTRQNNSSRSNHIKTGSHIYTQYDIGMYINICTKFNVAIREFTFIIFPYGQIIYIFSIKNEHSAKKNQQNIIAGMFHILSLKHGSYKTNRNVNKWFLYTIPESPNS
jgi:hypothetical protein